LQFADQFMASDDIPAEGTIRKKIFLMAMSQAIYPLYDIFFFPLKMGAEVLEASGECGADVKAEDVSIGLDLLSSKLENQKNLVYNGFFKIFGGSGSSGEVDVTVLKATIGQLRGKWKLEERMDIFFQAFGDGENLVPDKVQRHVVSFMAGLTDLVHAMTSAFIEFVVDEISAPMCEWACYKLAEDGVNIEVDELVAAIAALNPGANEELGIVDPAKVEKQGAIIEEMTGDLHLMEGVPVGILPIVAENWKAHF